MQAAAITALQHYEQTKTRLPVSHYLKGTDDSGHTHQHVNIVVNPACASFHL